MYFQVFIIFIVLIVVICFVYNFNRLVTLKQEAIEAWADVDVQLKRRYDLIPNIVSTVKGYQLHEKELLEQLTQLRVEALSIDKNNVAGKAGVESNIDTSLRSLFAVSENYPDLKASSNFLKLQEELTQTEDEIASSRRIYNSNVAIYNARIKMFPISLLSGIGHFNSLTYFQDTGK